MIKRKIKETISEYDKDGKIVRQTVTETQEDDDTQYIPYQAPAWYGDGTIPWRLNDDQVHLYGPADKADT